ncbi:hypothetical protein [Modestobacter sp. URMC 112]
MSEQLLYRYARASITIFDELLDQVFNERLASFLPNRVLPISTDPPKELALLLDDEFTQIAALLKPGRRASDQARARIRTLLAMEAHQEPDARVSDTDVRRVEKGIRAGKKRADVFPKLEGLAADVEGTGLNVSVHFDKKGEGAPVTFVPDDGSQDAAAIREVDLHARYSRSKTDLARDLGITPNAATALRDHLAIDKDPKCFKEFEYGKTKHRAYSDMAFTKMREIVKNGNPEAVRKAHNPNRNLRHKRCSIEGCQAG